MTPMSTAQVIGWVTHRSVERRGGEVALPAELRDQQEPDEDAVHGEHARPGEPVAEDGDRPGQREVLAPAFPRVHGEAAGLVREHRRRLGVDVRLQGADDGRDDPDDRRPDAAQRQDREREPDEQEAGVRHADHDPVPPAHRLQQTAFVYRNLSHVPSSRTTPRRSPLTSLDRCRAGLVSRSPQRPHAESPPSSPYRRTGMRDATTRGGRVQPGIRCAPGEPWNGVSSASAP